MHSKSVSAATTMSFPPNDLTLNLMRTFLAGTKVRRGRGASSSSPYHAYAWSIAKLQEARAQTPWGKGCAITRCTLQACSSRWICLPTNIPPSIPGLCIITYRKPNSYHFWRQISPSPKNSSPAHVFDIAEFEQVHHYLRHLHFAEME